MIFDIYIKEGSDYKLCKIQPTAGSDFNFFKSLRLSIDEQLDNIRKDILSLYPAGEKTNLISPKIDDYDIQKKIDKLVQIRNVDMRTKEDINAILKGTEFIICENCGHKMYKTPANVMFQKVGNSYIIEGSDKQTIDYFYQCENCVYGIDESIYLWQQNLKKLREDLLAEGVGFVPDNLGFYSWVKPGKKYRTEQNDEKCRHVYRRKVETYKLMQDGKPREFSKITERCVYCNEAGFEK